MYSSKKLLQAAICLLAVVALIVAVPFTAAADDNQDLPAPAGEGHVLYLQPNENWLADDAWFALYYFDYNDNYGWVAMTDADGDGIYEGVLPQQYPNFLFYRLSPAEEFDGEYVLNQTDCFEYAPEYSCYVLEEGSWELGQWITAEPAGEAAVSEETVPETEAPVEETEEAEETVPGTEAPVEETEEAEETVPETEAPVEETEETEEA